MFGPWTVRAPDRAGVRACVRARTPRTQGNRPIDPVLFDRFKHKAELWSNLFL